MQAGQVPDTAGKHETVGPERLSEIVAPDAAVTLAGVDHHVVPFVQPDVGDERPARVGCKEEKVATPQPPAGRIADSRLVDRPSRQVDAELPVHVLHQA